MTVYDWINIGICGFVAVVTLGLCIYIYIIIKELEEGFK